MADLLIKGIKEVKFRLRIEKRFSCLACEGEHLRYFISNFKNYNFKMSKLLTNKLPALIFNMHIGDSCDMYRAMSTVYLM